jgi:neural Wiskott-Aldrich syndrome protein
MPQSYADQFRAIPMSPSLGESLGRAHGFAREQGHRAVTLEHLLLAFTEDPDASAVLQVSNVDPVRLGTDVSGYLGRLLEDMRAESGTEPQIDSELLRVLHAAVQAAQQSRRRQIDGAIVLAAVVGDGKSPAAGLLKAHGLTFEEAIRALQKASAKARSRQFATPAPPPAAPAPVEDGNVPPSPRGGPADPATARTAQSAGQSVDDILAAARARIQQRTAALIGKTPAQTEASPAAPSAEPPPPQIAAQPPVPQAPESDGAEEAAMPAPMLAPAPPAQPAPPPPSAAPRTDQKRAAATPPEGLPSQRVPQPRPAAALPQAHLQPGEGPPRPPLPVHAGVGGPPQPGPPNRPARAPWMDADEPGQQMRSPSANGALAEGPGAATQRPAQQRRGQPAPGPLVETIPRRMQVGVAVPAQVRIGRERVDGLILLLMKGRGMAHRPDSLITRALSVRLRAPDGGFFVEATSPETQWVDTTSRQPQDDQISWRWTVTPQRHGRGRLTLVVAARVIGHDGIAAETSAPERAIEVTVTGGRLRGMGRMTGVLAALLFGAVLGRFGGEFWALGAAIIKRVSGQ